ncbi:hypothetical protein Pan153_63430 [Gimesia panareensis]|uniref:Uncharacterized protein n=1 Tax=Gimesia panareensis TaxID=2527978 RepID=A0A518FZ81_9PLAN|nr:hypothetical protein Pan153_63430 [Gimesia panareensis]
MRVSPPLRCTITLSLLSLAFIFLTRPGENRAPLSSFADHPLWFLGSFLVQPAFCVELVRQQYFDLSAILALVINALFFTCTVAAVWRSHKPPKSVIIQYYLIGLVLNFGNFVLSLMYSV